MRSPLLCLILLLGSCASAEDNRMEVGDRYFRLGQFHQAYQAYGPETEAETDVLRARINEAHFRSLLQSAEEYVLRDQIPNALLLLSHAEAMNPGYHRIESLRQHAYRRRSAELTLLGESFLDDGESAAAVAVFREALRWYPESSEAKNGYDNGAVQRGFDRASILANKRSLQAEDLYFTGLRQTGDGHNSRARTSFLHAANIMGEGSRAEARLDSMSEDLAAAQIEEAKSYIESNMLGAAWMALSDAVRLTPDNQQAIDLYASVSNELEARRLMNQADLHVRGGRIHSADELLKRILEVTGDAHSDRVKALEQMALQKHSERTYQLARACEIDQQIVRAVRLYDQILSDSSYGFEDLALRMENLRKRVSRAEQSFKKALAAEKSGNEAAYRRLLVETIELAGDYPEALGRLEQLQK